MITAKYGRVDMIFLHQYVVFRMLQMEGLCRLALIALLLSTVAGVKLATTVYWQWSAITVSDHSTILRRSVFNVDRYCL